jgi:hypothetical protein
VRGSFFRTSDRATPLAAALETAPCFIVRDHNGQALAFVRTSGKLFTHDKALAHRINIARAVSPVAPLLL